MHFFYLSTALASLLPVAIASPLASPADLVPRACTTNQPRSIYRISQAQPNDAIATTGTDVQRGGPPYQDTVSTVFIFDSFPNGATGCQLKFIIPKGATPGTANPDYSSAFQTDVWLLKASYIPTWNRPPQKDQMVSTIQFGTRAYADRYETILWSGICPTNNVPANGPFASQLQFLIEGSTWQQLAGSATLANSPGTSGFSVVYNC